MNSDMDLVEYNPQVEVTCDGRKLQVRRDQLTVPNLSKIFHVVPDTLYLVSDDGNVALPDEHGRFSSIEFFCVWQVEGVKSSKGASPGFGKVLGASSSTSGLNSAGLSGVRSKWKPKIFPRSAAATSTSTSTHTTAQETSQQVSQYHGKLCVCAWSLCQRVSVHILVVTIACMDSIIGILSFFKHQPHHHAASGP